MRESEIQKKIIKKLEADGWLVVKIIQCNKNGWPDLQAHRRGETVFIEVKQPGGKPTPLQEYRIRQLENQGFKVTVATNPNEV